MQVINRRVAVRWWLVTALGVVSCLLATCSPQATVTPLPTQILIPSTPTDTPTPITPSPTPPALQSAQDISLTAASTVVAVTPGDPAAAELVALAQRRLSQELDLPARSIQLIEVQPYTWTESSLGCPIPGQQYLAATADGYRIVLQAGDRRYLFHSDSDRIISCDPKNELLPGEATPEATEADATPDARPSR